MKVFLASVALGRNGYNKLVNVQHGLNTGACYNSQAVGTAQPREHPPEGPTQTTFKGYVFILQ